MNKNSICVPKYNSEFVKRNLCSIKLVFCNSYCININSFQISTKKYVIYKIRLLLCAILKIV